MSMIFTGDWLLWLFAGFFSFTFFAEHRKKFKDSGNRWERRLSWIWFTLHILFGIAFVMGV